jgi:N-acetylgalactosamine kinase
VNLIGEHVDYCGYSVLPMAIQYDIVMAVKPVSVPELQLTNTDSSHSDFQCDIYSFRYASTRSYNLGISVQKIYNSGMTVQIIMM